VLDNVTLALRHVHRAGKTDAARRGMELLAQVGLADFARSYPDRLSGGQQQRAAIVRALASDPEVLLLDEITSALDPELVGEVLELVRTLGASGTTILMATHEMAFARDVATHVVFLDGGVIREQGTPAEIFGAPRDPRTRAFLDRVTREG
jgi:ABC-type polar amino acid transport system ATPase subunit